MFKTIHQYYVYILASKKNGTIYIGVTNDLPNRVLQHKQKTNEGFTSKYDITLLVYFEQFQYIDQAIKREKQLKNWNRDWKLKLIEAENKEWKDLSEDWYN
jgi:putative endonuclease